jgi:hypothetical protein
VFGGNEIRYINDRRDFSSMAMSDVLNATDDDKSRENSEFVSVYDRGFPRTMVRVTRAISAGREILIDYGAAFWRKCLPQMYQELHGLEPVNQTPDMAAINR